MVYQSSMRGDFNVKRNLESPTGDRRGLCHLCGWNIRHTHALPKVYRCLMQGVPMPYVRRPFALYTCDIIA